MCRVLVVDNDQVQRADIVRAALEIGLEPVEAVTEEDVLRLIAGDDFPMAVIDIMPIDAVDMTDGLKVIRALHEKQRGCRIIALAARAGDDVATQALQAGADDCIATKWKFINWQNLLQQRLALWRTVAERQRPNAANSPKGPSQVGVRAAQPASVADR